MYDGCSSYFSAGCEEGGSEGGREGGRREGGREGGGREGGGKEWTKFKRMDGEGKEEKCNNERGGGRKGSERSSGREKGLVDSLHLHQFSFSICLVVSRPSSASSGPFAACRGEN